jgi:hypothetical protein
MCISLKKKNTLTAFAYEQHIHSSQQLKILPNTGNINVCDNVLGINYTCESYLFGIIYVWLCGIM